METKPLRPGTRHGNKVYYAPVTVSGRHIEIGTFMGDKAHAGRNAKTLKLRCVPLGAPLRWGFSLLRSD